MSDPITVRAYAKINWTLDVLHRRADGFHELRSIFQTVSLHDRVFIELIPRGVELSCDNPEIPSDSGNLVHRAAVALAEALGVQSGVRIHIEKRIPVGGGLGGGSSNAAAALLGLSRLWKSPDNLAQPREPGLLLEIAAQMGSDVPFFLTGGTALGIGRGEEVYPLEETRQELIVLANPGISVSTADAYRELSRLTTAESPRNIPVTLLAAKDVGKLPPAAGNDLEKVVLAAHPEIAEVKRRLMDFGATRALMSGSGATVFGVFDNFESSEGALRGLGAAGIWVQRVRTIDRQEYWGTLFE